MVQYDFDDMDDGPMYNQAVETVEKLQASIAALAAELEAVKVQLAKEQQSVNELVAAVQEMGRENKRLRTAAQAIVSAADKSDTDEVYRNMRGLRAALKGGGK